MPTTRSKPAYTLHRPTGEARVRIDGRDQYLGTYASSESHAKCATRLWIVRRFALASALTNTGTVNVQSGTLNTSAAFNNQQTLTVSGTLAATAAITNTGVVTINGSARLSDTGAAYSVVEQPPIAMSRPMQAAASARG
jgi:hypothetical protein